MEKKTFAFKLANESSKGARKWQTRDGVAIAGCSWIEAQGEYRVKTFVIGLDQGMFC